MTKLGFGATLKRIREARGLTQEELAQRAGVHRMTIAKWEGGHRGTPGLDNALALARALRVSVLALTGESRPETEAAIAAYLESPYARQLEMEGKPVQPAELEFLRQVVEGVWVEGQATPRALHSLLDALRNSPELQRFFRD